MTRILTGLMALALWICVPTAEVFCGRRYRRFFFEWGQPV